MGSGSMKFNRENEPRLEEILNEVFPTAYEVMVERNQAVPEVRKCEPKRERSPLAAAAMKSYRPRRMESA